VRKNSGPDVGSRRRLNLIEGSNVTLTVADDPTDEEVDVTIASSGTPESILMGCMFMSFSGLDVYSVAGTVTKESWGLKLVSSLTTPYRAFGFYSYPTVDAVALYDKNPLFECYLRINDVGAVSDLGFIIGGIQGDKATAAAKKFGIRIYAGNLTILSSDGTTQSESATLMTLSVNTWYRIRCKLTSGSQIEVWVDGVSKGTKNTNLPSGVLVAYTACPQIVVYGNNVTSITVHAAGLKVMHDY
jgi:hypothetical protein